MDAILRPVAIGLYWYTGCYIFTAFTPLTIEAALIGTISGLVLFSRVRMLERAERHVPARLLLALYVPPPILGFVGFIVWVIGSAR